MPRRAAIWTRKGREGYYATIAGRQVNLGLDRTAAEREFHRLKAQVVQVKTVDLLVGDLVSRYLDWARDTVKQRTWDNYAFYLASWQRHVGALKAADLKPHHVTSWLKGHAWNSSTGHLAVSCVRIWSSWSEAQGFLEVDPLKRAKRPRMLRRRALEPGVLGRAVQAIISQEFADFVAVMLDTGCRPGEIRTLSADRIDFQASTATVHGKVGPRVVSLTTRALEVLRRLAEVNPTGPVLRNTLGDPWTPKAIEGQMQRCSAKIGLVDGKTRATAYHARHDLWDRMIRTGADSLIVAKQLGHSNLSQLKATYAHVSSEMTREAVEKASQKS